MASVANPPLADVQVIAFDLFGTVFKWRETVQDACRHYAQKKLAELRDDNHPGIDFGKDIENMNWGQFVQDWRNSYSEFTKNYNPDTDPWINVDEHHFVSLNKLFEKTTIGDFSNPDETAVVSRIWHHLRPHYDCHRGLEQLSRHYTLTTLTNANTAIIRDLTINLPFHNWICAEDFKAYKPNPRVYLGAAQKLEREPSQIALVASHLSDLQAARGHGYRTIYVEREGEEAWDESQKQAAREWVDIWVTEDDGGLEAIARELTKIRNANNAPGQAIVN